MSQVTFADKATDQFLFAVEINQLKAAINTKQDQVLSSQVHTTGATLTIGTGVMLVILNPVATLATVAAVLPANPTDGQPCLFINGPAMTAGAIVTNFTVTAAAGIIQAPAFAPIDFQYGDSYLFRFFMATSKWHLI